MATNEIITKLTELAELRRMTEELNAEIDAIQDAIKAHMTEVDADTITALQEAHHKAEHQQREPQE